MRGLSAASRKLSWAVAALLAAGTMIAVGGMPAAGRTGTQTQPAAAPAGLGGRVWNTIPTQAKVVALTFDAGADAAGVASILSTLSKQHVPASFFRFPYGDYNAHTISVVNSTGFVPVGWTVDTLGWQGTSGGSSVAKIVNRLRAGLTAVGLAADPATGGYWVLKSNGGVDNHHAPWYGSLNGGIPAGQTDTAIASE